MITIIRFFCIFLMLVTFSISSASDTQDSGPTADPVPLELAKFVALDYAKNFYSDMGNIEFYDSEIYYDLNGNPAVYAIVLVSIKVTPLSPEQLKAKIVSTYSEIQTLQRTIASIENRAITGKAKSEKIKDIRAQILDLRKEFAGTEAFVTVICGADESHVPVLKLFRGLPAHLTQVPVLLGKPAVRNAVAGDTVVRTFFLGMFDLAFEFDVPTTRRSLSATDHLKEELSHDITLVHSRTGKIVQLGTLLNCVEQHKTTRVKAEARIRTQAAVNTTKSLQEKWDRFRNRYTQYLREKETAPEATIPQ